MCCFWDCSPFKNYCASIWLIPFLPQYLWFNHLVCKKNKWSHLVLWFQGLSVHWWLLTVSSTNLLPKLQVCMHLDIHWASQTWALDIPPSILLLLFPSQQTTLFFELLRQNFWSHSWLLSCSQPPHFVQQQILLALPSKHIQISSHLPPLIPPPCQASLIYYLKHWKSLHTGLPASVPTLPPKSLSEYIQNSSLSDSSEICHISPLMSWLSCCPQTVNKQTTFNWPLRPQMTPKSLSPRCSLPLLYSALHSRHWPPWIPWKSWVVLLRGK